MGKARATAITDCASGRKSLVTDYIEHILYITLASFVNYIVPRQNLYVHCSAK